ncbi:MAG: class I SAM-dependent methyltransferase [Gammaproteobacteria bacterium]|nr:class I SAM-dependent methyltransferase [Gammaproteobacteria bacterium]
MSVSDCRFCSTKLTNSFCDLGMSPLSNSYLDTSQLDKMERFYPLHAYVCEKCFLVQLPEFESPENIFSDYAYFSSYSKSWLEHAKAYAEKMIERFGFNENNKVIEVASNDGYLLQYFQEKGIPVLGIEPAENVAKVAQDVGISTVVKFFGANTAKELVSEGIQADLLAGNNVFAHVPDINDFTEGLSILLNPNGVITLEFPHLLRLIEQVQFDTIYHEHFSYLSLITVKKIFDKYNLVIFDVDELPTHGGSIRIYACHKNNNNQSVSQNVSIVEEREKSAGLDKIKTYSDFSERVKNIKRNILDSLIQIKRQGKSIVGYGAAAKGNTLLNYCGIGSDFIDYTVDISPHKQNHYLPGTHIPIYHPDKIKQTRPDYVFILPWNIKSEILEQTSFIHEWNGKHIIPIPEVEVIE